MAQEFPDFVRIFFVNGCQNFPCHVLWQFRDEVGGIVGIHLIDDFGEPIVLKLFNQPLPGHIVQLYHDIRCRVHIQKSENKCSVFIGEIPDDIGNIRRMRIDENIPNHSAVSFGSQVFDIVDDGF